MEIFYSKDFNGYSFVLGEEESQHCVRVLRRRKGDAVNVIDGSGTLFKCVITSDAPKRVEAEVQERVENWGSHPYKLTLAVCPTKNNDRYEWFAEKATEFGVDCIVPVIGEHSERKVYKTERLRRVVLSAVKQSLKGAVPEVAEPVSVKEFIASCEAPCKMIACCFEEAGERRAINEVLQEMAVRISRLRLPRREGTHEVGRIGDAELPSPEYAILIGPEGDFSLEEVLMAVKAGFIPVHLGASRLRTETAGVAAAAAVYFHHIV